MVPATEQKIRKWFWAWEDEKEENWLREMSKQGYHLKEPLFIGSYLFESGEPQEYIYRLDFMSTPRKEQETYLQLFQDAGWEHVGSLGGWQYFRTRAEAGIQ